MYAKAYINIQSIKKYAKYEKLWKVSKCMNKYTDVCKSIQMYARACNIMKSIRKLPGKYRESTGKVPGKYHEIIEYVH